MEELLNMYINESVLQTRCEFHDGICSLEHNIRAGNWIVSRLIKFGGCRDRMDFHILRGAYLEFVLSNSLGEERILKWYPYSKDDPVFEGRLCKNDTVFDAIPLFFQKHPVFKYNDWNDYTAGSKLKRIEIALKESISNTDKINRIKDILQ